MKSFVSIAMSFLFLFQGIVANMEVCEQIEKISDFIAHYQQHKSFDGDSFFEFAYDDLIANNHDSDGHHNNTNDDNTPLHSNHQCCQHFVILTRFETINLNSVFSEKQTQFNYYTFNFHSRYLETLFQPPQV
ncbi:MAG: hypothetical protein Q8O62_00170 [Aequorivita sp.]|nr:hypothetical protein [Aequorivita sp.]